MTTPTAAARHGDTSRRRDLVRSAVDANGRPFLNGIDFVEVSAADQRELTVTFVHPVPGQPGGVPDAPELTRENFLVAGGVRVTGVRVTEIASTSERRVVLRTDRAGDFSTYALRLVASPLAGDPPAGFDPVLAEVPFSFKVNCDLGTDCAVHPAGHAVALPAPRHSYLARDYASFRRLLLDRLSETMPGWQERSPADLGIALVELLAYVADRLSYYQDSVATEAYLDTARRRTSVRRHARLVDYAVREGANARAWLVLETDADLGTALQPALPAGSAVTVGADPPEADSTATPAGGSRAFETLYFETLHDLPRMLASRNAMRFYTWSEDGGCLPAGATRASLTGPPAAFDLARGDVLVLEEVLGGASGLPEDCDRTHRHPVRLVDDPVAGVDPLTGTEVTEIRWADDDALPFPLCLAEFDEAAGGTVQAAVARGNVVLADHGRSYVAAAPGADLVPPLVPVGERYRPVLDRLGLTHAVTYDHGVAITQPARSATSVDPAEALPAIRLRGSGETWRPRRDLLASDRFAAHFVVEMEDDGRARLRFGDGVLGRLPAEGTALVADYRLGGGAAGNVGPEALSRLVGPLPGVKVRNPLPAVGGVDPEPTRQVKLDAPQAFRTQERAVTAADYAAAAERHPDVQRAAATVRWTGSWRTVFVTVDRRGGRPVDEAFEADLRAHLDRFRMAGYDMEIDAPRFVAVDLALTVCGRAHHDPAEVESRLLDAFGAGVLADGRRGFFHPDNFTFGQPVYLSQVLAHAVDVPGVDRVLRVDTFKRYGAPPQGEIEQGLLPIHRLEIARLDNDPSRADLGRLEVTVLQVSGLEVSGQGGT